MIRRSYLVAWIAIGAATAAAAIACSSPGRGAFEERSADPDASTADSATIGQFADQAAPDAAACPPLPPPPTDITLELAPEYVDAYSVYELGPVPGAPQDAPLGGCVLLADTKDTLLIGVASESAEGTLYSVQVKRDACGHIVAYDGNAKKVANAPYVDATLLYGPGNVLIFPMWSTSMLNQIGQLTSNATTPHVADTAAIGIAGGGPGSAGFVPPTLPAAGQLRVLTQNVGTQDGYWYHVDYASGGPDGTLLFSNAVKKLTLPRWPGGFAYVPAGSPKFDQQSLIVAEWNQNTVATYLVDDDGDPVPSSRKAFFTQFPRPWGAYFEPLTGDYLFLTWRASGALDGGDMPDRLVVVAGFKPPPPPPPPK